MSPPSSPDEKPRIRRIGSLVNQLMSRRGYGQVAANEHLHRSIASAVGQPLATACTVGNLKSGVLYLYVSDSVSLQELNFRKRKIMRQLQQDFPDGKVLDIRFRIQASH